MRDRVVPFSEIDEACLSAWRPDSPFNIEIALALEGRLEPRRMRSAVRQAIARHPMAGARQVPARPFDRHFRWELTGNSDVDPLVIRNCRDRDAQNEAREAALSDVLPLDRSPPFRLVVCRGPRADALVLSASHVAMDGMGALRLMSTIASAYDGDPDRQTDGASNPARFLDRHLARPLSRSWFDRMATARAAYADAWQARNARLAGGDGAAGAGFLSVHLRLPPKVAAALRPGDGAPETRNDLLLAALTRAIERWNAGRGADADRVAIIVPLNLRADDDWSDGVGNFSVAAVVATHAGDRRDDTSLLASIREQTIRIKADAPAAALVDVYRLAALAPVFWKQTMSTIVSRLALDATMPTAVLSNLGSPDRPPSFRAAGGVRELWFSPPCRAPTSLAVGVIGWRRALFLSLRFHRAVWSGTAAAAFAREVETAARQLAGPRRWSSAPRSRAAARAS